MEKYNKSTLERVIDLENIVDKLYADSSRREQLIDFFDTIRPVANELTDKTTEAVVDFYLSKFN